MLVERVKAIQSSCSKSAIFSLDVLMKPCRSSSRALKEMFVLLVRYPCFMSDSTFSGTHLEQEILDAPQAVAATLSAHSGQHGTLELHGCDLSDFALRTVRSVVITACGSALNVAYMAKYVLEHWCLIPVAVQSASELRYCDAVYDSRTMCIAISQSGETMDTLMAMRHLAEQGATTLAIVNAPRSTIAREAGAVLCTYAGSEYAVASTKSFCAQLAAVYILALSIAHARKVKTKEDIAAYMQELSDIERHMHTVLERTDQIQAVAREYSHMDRALVMGRRTDYPVALEGALKLKELAYVHAQACHAGELKHGSIALVEPGSDLIVFAPSLRRPLLHSKVVSGLAAIHEYQPHILLIADDGDHTADAYVDHIIRIPADVPVLMRPFVAVPAMQILACSLAKLGEHNLDTPRNLAKIFTSD